MSVTMSLIVPNRDRIPGVLHTNGPCTLSITDRHGTLLYTETWDKPVSRTPPGELSLLPRDRYPLTIAVTNDTNDLVEVGWSV